MRNEGAQHSSLLITSARRIHLLTVHPSKLTHTRNCHQQEMQVPHKTSQLTLGAVGRVCAVCVLCLPDDAVGVPVLPRDQGRAHRGLPIRLQAPLVLEEVSASRSVTSVVLKTAAPLCSAAFMEQLVHAKVSALACLINSSEKAVQCLKSNSTRRFANIQDKDAIQEQILKKKRAADAAETVSVLPSPSLSVIAGALVRSDVKHPQGCWPVLDKHKSNVFSFQMCGCESIRYHPG